MSAKTTGESSTKEIDYATIEKYLPYGYPREWMDYVASMNIHQRMHGAMADLAPLGKDAKTNGGGNYNYHGHAAVTATVKTVLEKWRVFCSTTVASSTREDVTMFGKPHIFCEASVVLEFVSIDKPEDKIAIHSVGHGVDNSDKSIGKAVTYAVKCGLLKQFMISDGEQLDNEAYTYDGNGDREQTGNLEAKQKAEQRQQRERDSKAKRSAERDAKRNEKARKAKAQAAMDDAAKTASTKDEKDMTEAELFAAIGNEVEAMGRSRDVVGAYLKKHDNVKSLKDMSRERLLGLLREIKGKRTIYDSCLACVDAASNPEAAHKILTEGLAGRCLFELTEDEMAGVIPSLQKLAKASA